MLRVLLDLHSCLAILGVMLSLAVEHFLMRIALPLFRMGVFRLSSVDFEGGMDLYYSFSYVYIFYLLELVYLYGSCVYDVVFLNL